MVVLKKIQASTLMETLVSTVLIVIIFMISSMLLNNMFANSVRYNTHFMSEHLHELQYRYQNNELQPPYQEELAVWEIQVFEEHREGMMMVVFEATNTQNKKELTKTLIDAK